MAAQFLRSGSVTLTASGQAQALVLSNISQGQAALKFRFEVRAADVETPNIAYIRVYNLSDKTLRQIKEFDGVVLQAGYGDNVGIIFRGTVKQFKRGKESNVDSYLDIYAADSDLAYNFGFVNTTLAAGSTQQQLNVIAGAMDVGVDSAAGSLLTGGALPRGKTLFGLGRVYMRDLANTNGGRWSLQDGKIVFVPLTGVPQSQAVKLSSLTGLISIPEATDNGITAQCLLNPLIKIGVSVQINAKDITKTQVKQQIFPNYSSAPALFANTTFDGVYRVLVAEHAGDTRGQQWYTNIVCLSLDPSAKTVEAFG